MSRTLRFFCPEINKNTVLTDSQFHHLTKVLRLQNGAAVELFNGKGTLAKALINKIEKHQAGVILLDTQTFPKPDNRRIIIAPSIAKGERFDLLVAKCTELGVDAIIPTLYDRTVKQTIQPKRLNMIAIESSKQCRRLFLPTIDEPAILPQTIEKLKKDYPNAKFIFGSLSQGSISIMNFDAGENDCVAFIGPEGGLTDDEEKMLKSFNAQPVSLTNTVLRIETAAIAAASILAIKRSK
ncbi:MAG: 16S rRNA (uracil(1498)-N(3))-methyltransferase [Planctomycetaceae bacterium]|nr:16S rRNA (uracil(1498)-N(3))-methyltransferase [Planctomycetaceae bacterium]